MNCQLKRSLTAGFSGSRGSVQNGQRDVHSLDKWGICTDVQYLHRMVGEMFTSTLSGTCQLWSRNGYTYCTHNYYFSVQRSHIISLYSCFFSKILVSGERLHYVLALVCNYSSNTSLLPPTMYVHNIQYTRSA